MHRRLTATSSIPLHEQTKLGGGDRGEGEFDTGSQLLFTNTQKSFYTVVQISKEKLQYVELCSNMQSCRFRNFGVRNVVKTSQVR